MAEESLEIRRGWYFEAFEVGQSAMTAARTVTEADVVGFAALSGDWNPLHTDAEYAAGHLFGQRVAHGPLGLCIAEGLANRLGLLDGTALGLRQIVSWKFSRPIFIGDTIRVRIAVVGTRRMARLGGGMVSLDMHVLNQEDEVVQRGRWDVLVQGER
jgi:acyl dehydratase